MGKNTRGGFTALLSLILISWIGSIGVCAAGTDSRGAVSSESRICSEIGIELLERGVSDLGVGLRHDS